MRYLHDAVTPTALAQLRLRRQYRRRKRRPDRRQPPHRPSAVRTRRFPCGSAAQRKRPMAAAGAVEAVTFETASGVPWTWSCASCPPGGCAITAPRNALSASSASAPPPLVGTVPATLGDLWCIGRITSMCVRSRRAVALLLPLQSTVSAHFCSDLSRQNFTGQLPNTITRLRILSSMCADRH